MEEEATIIWHSTQVHINGYQIWPPSWALLASLVAVLLVGLITIAVLVYAARRDRDVENR